MPTASRKHAKKIAYKPTGASSRNAGKTLRLLTLEERLDDIRVDARQMCRTKASALAFLQRAGIVDASGALAEPFRT